MLTSLIDSVVRRSSPSTTTWLYDHTPPSVLHAISQLYFRHTVRWAAKHSPFYRRRFAEAGINPARVRRPSDLGDFYTTPDDLVASAEEFVCAPPAIVFESSGTSGKNKQVYYGRDELEDMGGMMAAGLSMMGITRDDRVANCFDFSIWIPGLLCHYGLTSLGCFVQDFGKVDPVEVYRRMAQYRYSVVMGEPTWLIRLTELAEKNGRFPLKLLIGGAEEMPAEAVTWMQDVWQGAKVKMCYGSVEQGSAFGFQPCDHADGYHIDDLNFLPEVIEPDEEGYGELVLTTLRRRVMPLIRYRTRDVTRIAATPCACGLRSPRIARIRGRRDELVVASGGNLYPKLFENIIAAVPGLTHDWQVVFRLEGIREVMEVHVESTRPDPAGVDRDIRQSATDLYPDLMKNLALGIFDMRVLVHPPGTVRVTRKLKRVVDRRHFPAAATTPAVPRERPAEAEVTVAGGAE